MIVYGDANGFLKEYLDFYIIKKLQKYNKFWNYRLFNDHLTKKEYLILLKSILTRKPLIYMSLESSIHSIKYMRIGNCDFQISYKANNSFYYNILVNEYLSGFYKKIVNHKERNKKIAFVVSNYNKIKFFMEENPTKRDSIDLFGLYGEKVPKYTRDDLNDLRPSFSKEIQDLYSNYQATICIDNSNEEGYLQGSYLPALYAGSVPIIKAEPKSLRNILEENCYISYEEFKSKSLREIKDLICKKSEYIQSKTPEEFFTPLFRDYINFIKTIDLNNMTKAIKISQEFRKAIISK